MCPDRNRLRHASVQQPQCLLRERERGIVIPVFKKLGFSFQVIDNYLNDPVPWFLPNSLQINAGLNCFLQ